MSLKDSFKGESSKDFFKKCKLVMEANTAKAADIFKTKLTDLRIEKLSKLSRNVKIRIGAGLLGVVVIGTRIIYKHMD